MGNFASQRLPRSYFLITTSQVFAILQTSIQSQYAGIQSRSSALLSLFFILVFHIIITQLQEKHILQIDQTWIDELYSGLVNCYHGRKAPRFIVASLHRLQGLCRLSQLRETD